MSQTKKNMNSATGGAMAIKTRDDFKNFAYRVNNGDPYLNAVLENDIDMNFGRDVKAAREQVPSAANVCVSSPLIRVPYCGVFDGNGHTISGVYGNCLFEKNNGVVRNLTVDGYVFRHHAAFIEENYGCIKNCVNKATVSPDTGAASGIVYKNYPKGVVTKCRNEGVLNICDLFYRPFEAPSQICHHRVSIDKAGSYVTHWPYAAAKTHEEAGELRLANDNSYVGLYLKSLGANGVFGHILDKDDLYDIIDLLAYYEEQGDTGEHINGNGENYLHLLLKCKIPDDLVSDLIKIIDYIGHNYNSMDFELKDNDGNSPEDLAKMKVNGGHPGFAQVMNCVQFWVDQLKPEPDEPIDPFGF